MKVSSDMLASPSNTIFILLVTTSLEGATPKMYADALLFSAIQICGLRSIHHSC